jgi:hypothetical protein
VLICGLLDGETVVAAVIVETNDVVVDAEVVEMLDPVVCADVAEETDVVFLALSDCIKYVRTLVPVRCATKPCKLTLKSRSGSTSESEIASAF